jgi:hypothetical protein
MLLCVAFAFPVNFPCSSKKLLTVQVRPYSYRCKECSKKGDLRGHDASVSLSTIVRHYIVILFLKQSSL